MVEAALTVPQAHRDHYRMHWRQLAQAAVHAGGLPDKTPDDLAERVRGYTFGKWLAPTDDRAAGHACLALVEAARAFVQAGTIKARLGLADLLNAAGAVVGDILDGSDPAEPGGRTVGRLKLWYVDRGDED